MDRKFIILISVSLFAIIKSAAIVFDAPNSDGVTIYYATIEENNNKVSVTSSPTQYRGVVNIPDSVSYNGVKYSVEVISAYAFDNNDALTEVTLGSNITTIMTNAFSLCTSLERIDIGNITSMEENVFFRCKALKEFKVSEKNTVYSTIDGVLVSKDKTELIQFPNNKTSIYTIPESIKVIGEGAFSFCHNITDISAPSPLYAILAKAFMECINLENISLGSSINSIGPWAFAICIKLKNIFISDSVVSIGYHAFSHCLNVTELTIGKNVTEIGPFAFNPLNSLKVIHNLNPLPQTGENLFQTTWSSIPTLHVPAGSVSAYKAAYEWKIFNITPLIY